MILVFDRPIFKILLTLLIIISGVREGKLIRQFTDILKESLKLLHGNNKPLVSVYYGKWGELPVGLGLVVMWSEWD